MGTSYPLVINDPEGTYYVEKDVLRHLLDDHDDLNQVDESELIAILRDDPRVRIKTYVKDGQIDVHLTSLREPLDFVVDCPGLFQFHAYGSGRLPEYSNNGHFPRVTPALLGYKEEPTQEY